MPLRKIRDIEPKQRCRHPDHNPPAMIVLRPGVYEHECPACGRKIVFTVPQLMSAFKRGDRIELSCARWP